MDTRVHKHACGCAFILTITTLSLDSLSLKVYRECKMAHPIVMFYLIHKRAFSVVVKGVGNYRNSSACLGF